jgi:hypothetical protein
MSKQKKQKQEVKPDTRTRWAIVEVDGARWDRHVSVFGPREAFKLAGNPGVDATIAYGVVLADTDAEARLLEPDVWYPYPDAWR